LIPIDKNLGITTTQKLPVVVWKLRALYPTRIPYFQCGNPRPWN